MIMGRAKVSAIELARWFIKNGYDQPRNTFNGNMKLQKLIYFSQLIHLAKYGEPLFKEHIFAFKNGSVIEDVRQEYRNNHQVLLNQSLNWNNEFEPEVIDTLNLTTQIFGSLSAKELSEINHQQFSWYSSYNRSYDPEMNFHFKNSSIIAIDSIIEHDLEKVRKMLVAYENCQEPEKSFELINGVTFYYDPQQTKIDQEILKELEEFSMDCDDNVYSFYIDDNLGIVIF